jgi:hypothetical protein
MGCLGVHYALSKEQADVLCELADDEELRAFFEEPAERWDRKWSLYGDKFWDGLHRCLTNGSLYHGDTPLHAVILGPDSWHEGEEYLINPLEPATVLRVVEAMRGIDRAWLRARYDTLDQHDCDWQLGDRDFACHWLYFKRVRAFFKRAAAQGRWVVFTVNL